MGFFFPLSVSDLLSTYSYMCRPKKSRLLDTSPAKMSLFGIGVRTCVLNCFSRVRLLVTPWTVAQETRLSMGFSRQEYWSGLPFPSPLESAENCNFRPATTAFSSVQFSHSVVSDSLRPHESQHARPPCPSSTPGVHSDSCPSSQ